MHEDLLINKCKHGDSKAFALLISNYRKPLFSYLLKICGDKETSEDLFQETLIKVWKGIVKYKDERKFSSWLFSIAHNTALDSLRKKKVRNNIIHTDEVPEQTNYHNPHTELVGKETETIISRAVNELPEKQKHVFLLRQHSKMTFKEIAEINKEPINSVLAQMHYAVKKIQTALRKENVI